MRSRKLRDFENKIQYEVSERLMNLIVFILGILSVVIGVALSIGKERHEQLLTTILISVGASLIASAVVTYLTSIYIFKRKKEKEITDFWGLNAIYETRQRMNDSSNEAVEILEENLDIIAFGLRSLRDSKGEVIKNKVKRGLKIRILTIHPNSDFLKQRERDELKAEGSIRQSIIQLFEWVNELKEVAPQKESISIKFYNNLPFDFYFRVDNILFIGPYLYGIDSQQTISFEFRNNAKGFGFFISYFDKLWNDKKLPKQTFTMED
jgi:hypothetical protein